jgi:spermidine/putrescine transport system permease protein
MKKFLGSSYFVIILSLLYIPIVIMMIFSFNSGSSTSVFTGWSLKWYDDFIHNSPFLKSIITSLFVAVVSTTISIVIGIMAVIGLWRMPQRRSRKWLGMANIPLINADVITAVSLMVIFLLAGLKFGIVTLIAAHISFNIPYVIITVMPFVRKIDKNLIAASKDLGSSETQTIFKVILPILRPSIITAIFICFAMSFDDFIISYFTSGAETNVSTFMYTAKRIQPYINAFGTILVTVIFISIILWNLILFFRHKIRDEKLKVKNGEYKLKKISLLKKEILKLEESIETESKIRKSKNPKWWFKYFLLKQKLKMLKNKNYNIKISKLEWKREMLANEIRSEKRIFKTYENAQKKQTQLQTQLEKHPDSHRVGRFQNALNKLYKKMVKLEREIEWINERRENEKEKVEHLNDMINALKTEMANQTELTKKDIQWYVARIHDYTLKRNIFAEGKTKYRLRTTIEKLATMRSNNLEEIQKIYEELNVVESLVFKTVPLTEKLDRQIAQLQLETLAPDEMEKLVALQKQRTEEVTDIKAAYKWRIVSLQEKIKLIEIERRKKYTKYFIDVNSDNIRSKNWIQKSWKGITLTGIFALSFGGLTAAYVLNNSFDIIIGNWGSYIDMSLISEFEKEYGVKVNYQQYDSNESLYNKERTMNYDVMVPSDYMVQRMADEDKLEKLDWTKIEGMNNPLTDQTDQPDKIDDTLKSNLNNEDGSSLLEYAFPYFWGDVRVAFNLQHDSVKKFIADNHLAMNDDGSLEINNFDWNLLWTAAQSGLKLDLSDDAKNLFMIGSKAAGMGVEPKEDEIETVKNNLLDLVVRKNVSLLGDQLINALSDGSFDIAVAYNGDILYGEQMYMHLDDDDDANDAQNQPFAFAIPTQGTNIWSDNIVINKRNRNLDLSYAFLNFIYAHSEYLSEYVGYPIASDNGMKKLEAGTYANFKELFQPTGHGTHYTYNEKRDNSIVNAYNEIISRKN